METGNQTPLHQEVQKAVRELVALRNLTKQTGTVTLRTQNSILQKLSPGALTRVAVILAELEEGGAK
jgi:hypothetical protein